MHLQHHCGQCNGTVGNAVLSSAWSYPRSRQLIFFSWQMKTTSPHLPLERKPKSSCSDLRNTSTATLQVWRPLGAGDQVRGQCRLQTEAWRHCAPRENQHQATEHHRTGSAPKENSLGGSRTDPGAEREAHCSQVPTSVERGAREKQGENEASDHA